GRPELVSLALLPGAGDRLGPDATGARLLAIAAALETGQPHPVAEAIRRAAAGSPLPAATESRTWPGLGVQARVDGRSWRLGNASFAGPAPKASPPGGAPDSADPADAADPARAGDPADPGNPGDTVIW